MLFIQARHLGDGDMSLLGNNLLPTVQRDRRRPDKPFDGLRVAPSNPQPRRPMIVSFDASGTRPAA